MNFNQLQLGIQQKNLTLQLEESKMRGQGFAQAHAAIYSRVESLESFEFLFINPNIYYLTTHFLLRFSTFLKRVRFQVQALPATSCVALDRSLNLSHPVSLSATGTITLQGGCAD